MAKYRVSSEHSSVVAFGRSTLHAIRMELPDLDGELEREELPGRAALRGWLEIDVRGIRTGNPLYGRDLVRRLEARKFPRIRGDLEGSTPLPGADRWRVMGMLALHGVRRPLAAEVRMRELDPQAIELIGELTFDMRDFAVEPPHLALLRVQPEVHVRGRIVAVRED